MALAPAASLANMQSPALWKRLLESLQMSGVTVDPSQSGGYNPRNIAGTNTPSQHAFGRAFDVNWTANPRGRIADSSRNDVQDATAAFDPMHGDSFQPRTAIPPDVGRRVAGDLGLTWGGDWNNPDPMHFEMPLGMPGLQQPSGAPQALPSTGPTMTAQGPQAMPHTQGPEPGFAPMGAGYFDRLMTNPAFLAGLSILGTQPGGNWGPAGAQAAMHAVRGRREQSEFERLQQRRATQDRIWGEAFPNGQPNPNHPLTRGIPPDMLSMIYAMGPEAGLGLLGKYTMTGSLERLKLELQQQLRQSQMQTLERLFTQGQGGQPPQQAQQPPAAGPDPFAAPATVMPPAAPAGPGMTVQPPTGGQAPPLPTENGVLPPLPNQPPPQQMTAPPVQTPQAPPPMVAPQSGMPPIHMMPGVRQSMLGSIVLGDGKGAFDAYNQEVGRRRAPQVAGETTRQQERAKLDVARPQARASVANSLDSLSRMEAEAQAIYDDPALARITGMFGSMPDITGGAAADLRSRLGSLVAQIGFSTLQAMREASKTGGALGSVSERELAALQNSIAGLGLDENNRTRQSHASFQRALMQVIQHAQRARGRLTGAYRDTYGEDFGEVPPATVFPTRPERRTLGGKRYIKIDGQWFEE